MPRVLFTISYSIKPDQRSNYLTWIADMKNHLVNVGKKNYSVFEAKGKKNQFTEIYVFNSEEEYDALDESQDEHTQELLTKLESCVDAEGMKYSTAIEI